MESARQEEIVEPDGSRAQIEFVFGGQDFRLDSSDVAHVRFEAAERVREPPSWKHKRNYSGLYWAATTRSHVWFESLYERSALMRFDRDAEVVGLSAQPMWICWPSRGDLRHAPDYFVRFAGGACVVVDVKPADEIKDSDAMKFSYTDALCASLGWGYRVVHDIGEVEQRNLRFLSGYRYDRWRPADGALTELRSHRGADATVASWTGLFGRWSAEPLGATYWALWWRLLRVDMTHRLSLMSKVVVA